MLTLMQPTPTPLCFPLLYRRHFAYTHAKYLLFPQLGTLVLVCICFHNQEHLHSQLGLGKVSALVNADLLLAVGCPGQAMSSNQLALLPQFCIHNQGLGRFQHQWMLICYILRGGMQNLSYIIGRDILRGGTQNISYIVGESTMAQGYAISMQAFPYIRIQERFCLPLHKISSTYILGKCISNQCRNVLIHKIFMRF